MMNFCSTLREMADFISSDTFKQDWMFSESAETNMDYVLVKHNFFVDWILRV